MKILITHIGSLNNCGGIETFGKNISQNIQGDVYFLVGNKLRADCDTRHKNVFFYKQPWDSPNKKYLWPIKHGREYEKRLKEIIKDKGDFDIIVNLHSSHVLHSQRVSHAKIVFIMPSFNKIYFSKIKKNLNLIEKKVWKNLIKIERRILADKRIHVVVLSKLMKRLIGRGNCKTRVIVPGAGETKGYNAHKKIDCLLVSRMDPVKNVVSFVNMADSLRNFNFTAVGGGAILNQLKDVKNKKKISNLKFAGAVKNPVNFYLTSKIFIIPSLYESFGLVILEAFASGLPVIAFKPDGKKIITASDEIISNGKTGFLVSDEKEMSEKIAFLIKNSKLREKMGKAAIKEAKKYSWKKCAGEIVKFAKT